MNKRPRLREALKSVLIVLLIISTVLMVSRVRPFSGIGGGSFYDMLRRIFSSGDYPSPGNDNDQGGKISLASGANQPFAVSAMSEGGRWASLYDAEATATAFKTIGSVLGEALGSAGNAKTVSESEWRGALGTESVYFDYYGAIPAEVLASWLGTSYPSGLPAVTLRHVLLTVEGEGAGLWFRDEATGEYYRCQTEVKRTAFETLFASAKPNGAAFAFELGEGFSGLAPYTLLPGETPSPEFLDVSTPLESEAAREKLLQALGFGGQSGSQYPEADGTPVYVESTGTLRVSADGNVLFRASSGYAHITAGDGTLTAAGAVAFARYLAQESAILPGAGGQDIYLVSVTRADGAMTAVFDYCMGGVPIRLEGEKNALSITFDGSNVAHIEMNVRAFHYTGNPVTLLPEKLAAAAAKGGRELHLGYVQNPDAEYEPVWLAE